MERTFCIIKPDAVARNLQGEILAMIQGAGLRVVAMKQIRMTRQQAEAQGLTVKSHKAFLLANGRAVAQDQTEGYYELLSDAQTGRLVGAVFAGANATELIHVVSVALAAQMTAEQLKEVIFAHPTFAESIGEALHR